MSTAGSGSTAGRVSNTIRRSRSKTSAVSRPATTKTSARSQRRYATTSASSIGSRTGCRSSGSRARASSYSTLPRVRPDDSDPPVLPAAGHHLAPDLVDPELPLVGTFDGFPVHLEDRAAERIQVAWTVLAHRTHGAAEPRQPRGIVDLWRVDLHGSRVLPADRAIDRRRRHVCSERVGKEGRDVGRDKRGAAGVTEVVANAADVAWRAPVTAGPVDAGFGGPEPLTRGCRRRDDRG